MLRSQALFSEQQGAVWSNAEFDVVHEKVKCRELFTFFKAVQKTVGNHCTSRTFRIFSVCARVLAALRVRASRFKRIFPLGSSAPCPRSLSDFGVARTPLDMDGRSCIVDGAVCERCLDADRCSREAIFECYTVSRPVSNLSASCPDVAASLWPAVAAAAFSSAPSPLGGWKV